MKLISCGQCQATLSVPDEMAGKLVRCPQCAHVFTAGQDGAGQSEPAASSSAESRRNSPETRRERELFRRDEEPPPVRRSRGEFLDEDEPEEFGVRRQPHPSWKTVKAGLQTMYVSILVMVFGALTGLFLTIVLGGVRANADLGAMAGVCLLVTTVGLGLIAYIVGMILCAVAPEPRTRAFAVASLICYGVTFVLFFLQVFLESALNARGGGMEARLWLLVLVALNGLLSLAAMVLFVLFLKRTARLFRNERLEQSCTNFLVFQVVWVLVMGGLLAGMALTVGPRFRGGGAMVGVGALLGIVALAGTLVYLFWFLGLLGRTRDSIRQALDDGQRY